jgi:hypothetical protein
MGVAAATSAGAAEPAKGRATTEELFVGLSVVLCMQTGAEPSAVRKIATSKQWARANPESTPGVPPKFLVHGKAYEPTDIWTFDLNGTTFWLSMFDIANEPALKYCSLKAYNLDSRAIDAGFNYGANEGLPPDLSNAPVKQYRFKDYNGRATYLLRGTPDEILHEVSFIPEK